MSAPAPSVAPAISLLPLYHCQVTVVEVCRVVRVGQGGRDCHAHLGLQRGQGHRSGLLHVGDLNGQFFHSGRVFSAVGCLDRNYVGVVAASSALRVLKVGGTLECEHPVLYVEVFHRGHRHRPANDQTIDLPSGSTAVRVATAPVPFSGYSMVWRRPGHGESHRAAAARGQGPRLQAPRG